MKLNYTKGNATNPIVDGTTTPLILHICNDEGGWGSGFVLGLNQMFGTGKGSPRERYNKWYIGVLPNKDKTVTGPFKLGQVQFCRQAGPEVVVVNMIAQSTPGGYNGFAPIRYQSLEECLMRIRDTILHAQKPVSLHGPRFGAGLAGGDWNEIEKILLRVFKDVDVEMTIYDWDGK